jgi:hypothetical protein
MGGYGQCAVDLSIAENPQTVLFKAADDSCSDKFLRADLCALLEFCEIAHIDRRKFLLEWRIRETALGHAAV